MDPLSVASGVAGLVTLADVVISRTYNTIIACKHASEDSRKLLREVQALTGILQSLSALESKLGATALHSQIPAAQVLSCQQTLQEIRDRLQKSDPKEDGISVFQKAKRTLKWPLSSSDTEKFLLEMQRHKSTFDLALSVDALDAILSSQSAKAQTDIKIDDIADQLAKLRKIESEAENRRLFDVIGAADADETYRANLKLRQHGTGLWFLEQGKPFSTWLLTSRSKLWVYGIPGAGKTILSALAISKTASLASITHGVAFYYCSHRYDESRRLTGILRCLIGQLARQNEQCVNTLARSLKLHEHTSEQAWTRDDDELELMLRKMIRQFNSVSIVIDGVDECYEATKITETLASIASESSDVRLLIFSRKETEMEPFLEDYVHVSIAAESQDLRLYVPAQIETRTRLRKLRIRDPNVKDEIIETLVNGADGMFRWVVCQLDHLCDLATDEERLSALSQLPRTLKSTYDRILERVIVRGESICKLVEKSLVWIFSPQPLGLRELCEAVSIEPHAAFLDARRLIDLEEILISCGSLVRLSADGHRIESAHFTVVEYLRDIDPTSQPLLARFRISDDFMNTCMAETCLTALTFDNVTVEVMRDPASLIQWLRQFPFYWHAAISWDGYARKSPRRTSIVALTKKLFLGPRPCHYQVWAHMYLLYWNDGLFSNDLPRLISTGPRSASDFGREDNEEFLVPYTYVSEWTWALRTSASWGKLRFATLLHQDHILRNLFGSIEELNDAGSIGTPLHFALLGHRALRIQSVSLATFEEYPFRTRHDAYPLTEKTVKTLLDLGADMNVKFPLSDGTAASTALIAYATNNFEVAIESRLSLDKDTANWLYKYGTEEVLASIRSVDIYQIAERDRPSVLRLLQKLKRSSETVNSQVTVDATTFFDERNELLFGYGDLLYETCKNHDLPTVQWFFERSRVSFDHPLDRGKTILHMACRYSSMSIVEYLIERGVKVDKIDLKGKTPLRCMFKTGYNFSPSTLTIMTSLLKAGAKAYGIDGDSNSCLHCWARMSCSREQISQLQNLLDTIVTFQSDRLRVNDAGETVWHILAANQDGHRLSKMLIAANWEDSAQSTVDVVNKEGWTPLHVATLKDNGKMMQMLMNLGCSVTKNTTDGQTVLDLAIKALSPSNTPITIALGVEKRKIDEGVSRLVTRRPIPDQLMVIIRRGDLTHLMNFAAAGGNLELSFESCTCTPMTVALMESQVAIVEYLQSLEIPSGTIVCRSHHPQGFSALGVLASQDLMFELLREALASSKSLTVQDFEHMIHAAAANGNRRALQFLLVEMGHTQLIESSRRINLPVYRFRPSRPPYSIWIDGTALHTAVKSGKRKCVEKLLKQGFDPDALDSKGVPCLHLAAQRGDSRTLELLLSHGGTVDVRNAAMLTTLGLVVSTDHINIVRLLLEHGADISARDHRGYSLLRLASMGGNLSAYFLLVDAGLKPTLNDITAWYDAGFRQIWMAKDYMERMMVVPGILMPRNLPEARAVTNLVPPYLCKLNLTCRCTAMNVRVTALYLAATLGRLDFTELLLDAGAMLNLEGGMEGTPLMGACRTGRLDVVRYLVRNGAILSYTKHGVHINAFHKASSYPRIQRWFLVERFTEQRMIAAGDFAGDEQVNVVVDVEVEDTYAFDDEIADVTLDLVLENDLEQYLESKNWFLPMRRFVDDGKGAFERVPIMPEEFAKYRPLGFKVSPG